jgi:hypothetical protein
MSNAFLDKIPLWRAFPDMRPDNLRDTQGLYEAAVAAWRPFWQELSDAERAAYLLHWQASTDWRDALAFYLTSNDTDAAADARESEEMLARRRQGAPARRGLWQRLFGNGR